MDLGLEGSVVVVTGAASGMGAAVATQFSEEGARVIGVDVQDPLAGSAGVAEMQKMDVTDQAAWASTVRDVRAQHGSIDVLCNIAGPGSTTGHLDTSIAEWHRQIDGHLLGVYLGCTSVLPGMIEQGAGKIVNMCSFTAHGAVASIPGYAAAFGGILAYTKSLARFAAPHNINVNCVSPGNISTPMTRAGWLDDQQRAEQLRQAMPIRRVGRVEDVAGWFPFLASRWASHAVGVEVNVSGGQVI